MARQQAANPLTSTACSPMDIVDHARAVVQMLEEMVGGNDFHLSEKGAFGLNLTLQWLGITLEEASQQISCRLRQHGKEAA